MRSRILPVFLLTLALVMVLGGAASAATYTTAGECYACHGTTGSGAVSKVDFGVGAVNYTKCTSCHAGYPGAGHYHFGYAIGFCTNCHDGEAAFEFVPPPGATAVAGYRAPTPFGTYATSTSLSATPAQLHDVHASLGWVESSFGSWGASCSRCHAVASCAACHDEPVAHGEHSTTEYSPVLVRQATGATVTTSLSSCMNPACHNPAVSGTASFIPTCTSCHTVQADPHGYDTVDHVAADGDAAGIACSACHTLDLAAAHGDPGAAGASCATCHPSPRDTLGVWDQTCATGGCHTVTSSAPMHADADIAHSVSTSNAMCLDCHAGTDLGSIHADAVDPGTGKTSCFVCHTGIAGQPATSDCTVCHFTFADHYDTTAHTSSWSLLACGGAGCHTTTDLAAAHEEHRTEAEGEFGCDGCHGDFSVAGQIEAGLTGCGDCHLGITQTSGHRTAHWPTPLLQDAAGPHYSYYTGSEGTAPTGDCAGCHTSNLVDEHMGLYLGGVVFSPRLDAAGAALTCGTCHDSADARVIGAIASGTATCESCHDVHGPMQNVHASSFVDDAAVPCADCHDANLINEHNGGYTSSAGLTGCDVCHSLFTSAGEMGTAVQNAISVTNDTRCSACHVAYHTDSASHDASTAASLECGTCHAKGQAVIDVTALHANSTAGACAVCHNNSRIGDISAHTAECASCHAAEGTDYHTDMASGHTFETMDPSCTAAGCHVADTLPEEHERFLAGSGYTTTCDLCHANTDAGRIDWATASADCASCHEVHGDIGTIHTATASQSCVDCHGTGDVRALHGTSPAASCAVCHAAPAGRISWDTATVECASCHGGLVPVDPNHYPVTAHLTSHETVCTDCHFQDLKTEHAKASIDVSCAECHQTDAGIIAAGWNRTCAECHGDMHDEKVARHASARSDCSSSGCHASDVSAIHSDLPQMGCTSCHTSPGQLATDLTKNCTDSGCHVAYHDRLPGLHTATASSACTGCHPESLADGSQLEPVHQGRCATCHNAAVDPASKTAECASCHAVAGTDYHALMDGKHTFSTMGASCTQAGCHLKTLPEEHAKYLTRYPGYTDSCALCHANTNPARINWATASADCATCHEIHGDIAAVHATTASQACVACHETGDVRQLHGTSVATSCDVCHAAAAGRIDWATATVECASCHGALTPVDPNHYSTAAHDASAETGCNQCHLKDMKAEHAKATVGVGCVQCHESKVDALTTPWDKTCAACHPTNHGDRRAKHTSTTTGCAGSGCHVITDVAALHNASGGPGCGACHVNPTTPATTTACTASGCHASVGSNHHAAHNAATANPGGCNGCHIMYLDDEHSALGFTCDTCHASTAAQAVKDAIAAGDLRCKSCHPAMHGRQGWEFNPGRASVHRVSADLPGMRSSFVVNGTTYSWSLPNASTFLKAGWTTSSMMSCADCHSYSGAAGPHGATMKVNIDPAYPNSYKATTGYASSTAQLSPNSPTGMSMSDSGRTAAGIICEKCHDLYNGSSWSNIAHKEHDDRGSEGSYCTHCHISLPHGWSRPRMIGYTTDAAPYATYKGGISRIALKSYTPNGWSKSDCGASCSSGRHPLSGTSWPATDVAPPVPTTGSVSGTVTSSATGAAISGAAVSVGGKTATTGSNGTYTASDVTAGTYTMTVSASGFTAWSGSVTVTAGSTLSKNVTLSPAAVVTTGAVSGTVANSSTSVAVAGATVSAAGKTATTASNGTYAITDVAAGTYTMTVAASGYTTWSGPVTIVAGSTAAGNVSLVPIPVTPVAGNIARTGTVTASSTDDSDYASRAIDGSTSTYWRSNSGGTQWLRVDLKSVRTFEKVVVNWDGSRFARAFSIQTSNDGTTWTTQYSTTSGTSGTKTITFAPVSARYVRVYCTTTNDSHYRIREFEVWGY